MAVVHIPNLFSRWHKVTMRTKFFGTILLFSAFAAIASGCGGGGAPEGVKVTGSVTKAGKALEGVAVSFNALDKDKGISKEAATDADGKFELKLKPGKYTVTLSKFVDKSGNVPKLSDEAKADYGQLLAAGLLKQTIAPQYANFDTSPFNNIDIPAEGKQLAPFDTK